jgi:hypothetical protein
MKRRKFKFYFKGGPITVLAFTEENAKILAQAEAIKRGWDPTIISESEANEMNKRQYISWLEELQTLPVPGTTIYPPMDKVYGRKLLRYEITENNIWAVIEGLAENLDLYWTIEQVRKCTWNKC